MSTFMTLDAHHPSPRRPPSPAAGLTALGASKLRMLLIVNPRATTVSSRLKNLVVYALRGRYDVDARRDRGPQPRHRAGRARRSATDYDLVVAFGGDGTLNEAANGLAGSDVPLTILPGGCTNVVCRMLGIPTDIVDATEHLLRLADGRVAAAIDLGSVNGRYFVFSSGVGLDADTARWVDERQRAEARAPGRAVVRLRGDGRLLRDYRGRPAAHLWPKRDGRARRGRERPFVQNSRPIHLLPASRCTSCEDSVARQRHALDGRS